jgi:hypothetical protein
LADFTINVEFEQPREVRVVVYDSVKGLRIAATKYEQRGKSKTAKSGDSSPTRWGSVTASNG